MSQSSWFGVSAQALLAEGTAATCHQTVW